jgi:hypothetical protein
MTLPENILMEITTEKHDNPNNKYFNTNVSASTSHSSAGSNENTHSH